MLRKFIIICCVFNFYLLCNSQTESCKTLSSCISQKYGCANQFDYIIVGNGTAGATLAHFLSDPVDGKFKNTVLVLEQGPNYSNDPVILNGTLPVAFTIFRDPKYSVSQLVSANLPLLGLRGNTNFSIGRMWGGSSAHLHFFAVRGTADIYDQWASISGNNIWTFNNLLPLMKFMEDYTPNGTVPGPTRGLNGALPITQEAPVDSNAFAQAISNATGIPLVDDYNTVDLGVSARQAWFDTQQIRTFSSRSYLDSTVVSSEGVGVGGRKLTIFSESTVQRILFDANDKTKTIGVEFIRNDQSQKVFINKNLILCAGPFSPAILQRSGVGPASLLNSLNIPVVVDSPNVGANLQNHYGVTAAFKINNPAIPVPPIILGFLDNNSDLLRTFQIIIGYPLMLDFKIVSTAGLTQDNLVTISCFNLRTRSRGTIEVPDNDPLNMPRVNYNYYSDGDLTDPNSDASMAVQMFKTIKSIGDDLSALTAGGVTLVYPEASHFNPGNEDLLFADAQASNLASHHYVGTCRMGTNISNGVVNGRLQVFGTKNLMIADNSIAPLPETGNTAYQAYLIALVAAKILGVQLP